MLNTDCFKVLLNKYKVCIHQFPHLNFAVFIFKTCFLIFPHQVWLHQREFLQMVNKWDKVLFFFLHGLVHALIPLSLYSRFCCCSYCWEALLFTSRYSKVIGKYKQKLGQNALHPARKCLMSLKLKDSLREKEVENTMSRYVNIKGGIMCPLHRYSHGTGPAFVI